MAKQIINIGSGQNEGDGGDTRLAFEKINSNFNELYAGGVQTLTLVGTTLAISGGNQVTLDNVFEGGLTADVTGSVFADDSTLLVDGVSGTIPAEVVTIKPFTIIAADNYRASTGERIVVPAAYAGSADILGPLTPSAGDWFVVVNGSTTTGSCRVDPEGTGSSYVSLADETTAIFVYDGTEWNTGA